MEQQETPLYATLLYGIKKQFNLSGDEYLLADMIYHLQIKTGYCYKSPAKMGECLGIQKRQVNRLINRLIDKGLIQRLTDYATRVTDVYIEANRLSGTNRPAVGQIVPAKRDKLSRGGTNMHAGGTNMHAGGTKMSKQQGARITYRITLDNTELDDAFNEYRKMRKAIRSPMTERAEQIVANKLKKLYPDSPAEQLACLNQSIERGWKSVFIIKEPSEDTDDAVLRAFKRHDEQAHTPNIS